MIIIIIIMIRWLLQSYWAPLKSRLYFLSAISKRLNSLRKRTTFKTTILFRLSNFVRHPSQIQKTSKIMVRASSQSLSVIKWYSSWSSNNWINANSIRWLLTILLSSLLDHLLDYLLHQPYYSARSIRVVVSIHDQTFIAKTSWDYLFD
jgi:hypothetical protein